MSEIDYYECEDEAAEEYAQQWVLESLIPADSGWWEWLCEEAQARQSPEKLANWLNEVRATLDSFDPNRRESRADDFQGDRSTFSVRWKGLECHLGNTRQFALLEVLAKSTGKYLTFQELAELMGGDQLDDVRHVKYLLAKALREAGMADLAACIKTQRGHYGLFFESG